ncbi:unnamed protein product [Rhizophagus irregularis]|nr:unnamed protein product [Rhizophagus irregularis]CAB5377775.1 unnamed protein product [Rhizophagus irregularis]
MLSGSKQTSTKRKYRRQNTKKKTEKTSQNTRKTSNKKHSRRDPIDNEQKVPSHNKKDVMGNEENEQIMRTAVRNERNQMRNEIHKAKNKSS